LSSGSHSRAHASFGNVSLLLLAMYPRVITQEELANATRFGDFIPVYKVDARTVVKTGDSVRLAEAAAMRLVREKTTIPVPEIYNAYTDNTTGHVRIVMEFIEGDCLSNKWDQYDAQQKEHVLQQLHDMFAQLRNIKGMFIGSVDESACEDPLFEEDIGTYGPYMDEASFYQGIIKALKNTLESGWVDTVCAMVGALSGHEIVLTHGDMSPRNILVQDGKIVAILDWEMAGYYPEYWEYVKALYRPAWESRWIADRAVDRVLQPYLVELAVFLHVHSVGAW
jgi:tRNA A-37 threonylcarbamoyl transferase component Bud32